ncbi:hypothetical protein BI364_03265 [Acidihalobacter yilgarnensis]|uniref:Uncharacterized protein n=1 Tax=Acidihalobacter yilgarnensis TaxID=2819280 RepID=A0A1D8ISY9_9GAMM|nr:hypothetical protein BI364_03265 [Acidihalobacter yilgarnensis]
MVYQGRNRVGSVKQPSNIDRFEVRGILGKGAQGAVYQAYDPRLERLVAIKTVLSNALGDARAGEWLMREARIVGGLKHPNIVPLFEAGVYPEGVFLIFEYVEGASLAERLRSGPSCADEAPGFMLDVLAGVEAAHAAEILHRDIKPSNVLIGGDGRARVTDFGIAMAATAVTDTNLQWGSVPYLSPEQVTGGTVDTRSDVFALGVLFYELLTGKRAFTGDSPEAIRRNIVQRRLDPPSRVAGQGDPRLDQLVLRATARTPEDRYTDAGEFRLALAALSDVSHEAGRGSGLDFMLRRIKRKPDFPGFSRAIQEINRLSAEASNRSVGQLANVVLQDYATTQKLLRLANSSYYGQFGGNIRTISRAIMILGFEQVRMAALSLILFENLKDSGTDRHLVEGLIAALHSAVIAKAVAEQHTNLEPEQVFICALMYTVGRLLVIYYFPEEYADIRLTAERRRVPESSAAREVLGVDYARIGKAVLKEWNFPAPMIQTLTPVPEGTVSKPGAEDERLRVVCAFANELSGEVSTKSADASRRLDRLATRFQPALGLKRRQLDELIESSRSSLRAFVAGTGISLPDWALSKMHVPSTGSAGAADAGEAGAMTDFDAPTALQMSDEQRLGMLMAGVNDVTASLMDKFNLAELLQGVLEIMYRGAGAEHAVLFLLDAAGGHVTARLVLGDRAEALFGLRLPSGAERRDVIALGLSVDKDIVVQEVAAVERPAQRYLPSELDGLLRGERFLVLPLVAAGRRLGLFYLDLPPGLILGDTVLAAIKTLRNQAVMALRQGR